MVGGDHEHLYTHSGRGRFWKGIKRKLPAGCHLAPGDRDALGDLCAGVTWMERLPPPLLRSYGVLYSVLRGSPSKEEDEISRDVLRTVRVETGHFFDFSGKMKEDLASTSHRILNAIARVDGMGYCQGENYVVDIMLKAGLPEQETFCLFLYALRQQHLHGIFRKEVPVLTEYLEKFEEHLQRDLPKLYSHFKEQNYSAPLYALEWITTLFALAARPLVALVILDLFLSSARNPILRLCLAMLSLMESELLPLDQEGLLREFRRIAVGVDEEEVWKGKGIEDRDLWQPLGTRCCLS
ncbi:unnamed protein product [Discosporangium mesarthrocarpum]